MEAKGTEQLAEPAEYEPFEIVIRANVIPSAPRFQAFPIRNTRPDIQNITLQEHQTANTKQILQAYPGSQIISHIGNNGGAQQMQPPEPMVPTGEKVINQPPLVVTKGGVQSGTLTAINTEVDKEKPRLRRFRCTCPNCTGIHAKNKGKKQKEHLCHIPGCGKVYAKTSDLSAHIRTHTGDRPFACLYCGKRFNGPNLLKRHRLIHTGEKPFLCPKCPKAFTRSDHLTRHVKMHSKNGAPTASTGDESGETTAKINLNDKLIKPEVGDECVEGEVSVDGGDKQEVRMVTISTDGEQPELIIGL